LNVLKKFNFWSEAKVSKPRWRNPISEPKSAKEAYLAGSSPAEALAIAQTWLKTQTYTTLLADLQQLQQRPNLGPRWQKELAVQEQIWVDNLGKIDPDDRPYADPFHWAGFTLAGLTADSTHERI
jgi:CHAT domain-containing protein